MVSLLQDLLARPWALWALCAVVVAIAEVSVPSFTFAFISVAALVAMVVSFSASWVVQVACFLAALFVTVTFVRPRFLGRLHKKNHQMPSRSQELVGEQGEVSERIDPVTGAGRVVVRGQDWAARGTESIVAGRKVKIEGHDGIVLIVKEI